MIFHRRVIQAELNNLRAHLDGFVVDRFIKRLNTTNRERLSAMWEVIIISALCELGTVTVEAVVKTGRRPDISFDGAPTFVADITSISDQGLEDRNPVDELSDEIERAKKALGLPIGGVDLRIGSLRRRIGKGQRVDLRIPDRTAIADFVERRLAPEIRSRLDSGELPMRIEINDDDAELTLVIDPSKCPYSSGSHPSFDVCEAIDRNPLAHALERKAEQLRDAEGLKGIFVCDTGSSSVRERIFSTYGHSPKDIVHHFLRADDHIDFVMTFAVWEQQFGVRRIAKPDRRVDATLFVRSGSRNEAELTSLRDRLAARLPIPRATGDNGRRQAGEDIYRWGFHGGYSMTNRSVKISLREMTEGALREAHRRRNQGQTRIARRTRSLFCRSVRMDVAARKTSCRCEDSAGGHCGR